MLARYNPFNDLFRDDFWNFAVSASPPAPPAFTPAVDVVDTEGAYVLKVEVPGVKAEDISVSVENNVLTFKGERRFEQDKEEQGYRRIERRYGSFTRSFVLPEGVQADGIEAAAKDGVLTIQVPKAPAKTPRRITVKSGDLLDKAKQLFSKKNEDAAQATPS